MKDPQSRRGMPNREDIIYELEEVYGKTTLAKDIELELIKNML